MVIEFPGTSVFILPADEPSEEEEAREVTKEEHELGVVKSWMEIGGVPALAEEEARGLLHDVYPFYLVCFSLSTPFYHCSYFLSLIFVMDPHFFPFSGFGSVKEG